MMEEDLVKGDLTLTLTSKMDCICVVAVWIMTLWNANANTVAVDKGIYQSILRMVPAGSLPLPFVQNVALLSLYQGLYASNGHHEYPAHLDHSSITQDMEENNTNFTVNPLTAYH